MPYRDSRPITKWTVEDAEYMKEKYPLEGFECFRKYREKGISYDQCRYFVISLGLLGVVKRHG